MRQQTKPKLAYSKVTLSEVTRGRILASILAVVRRTLIFLSILYIGGCGRVEHPIEVPYSALGEWCSISTKKTPFAEAIHVTSSEVIGYMDRSASRELVRIKIEEITIQRPWGSDRTRGIYLRGKNNLGKPEAIFFDFPEEQPESTLKIAEVGWLFFDEGYTNYIAVRWHTCDSIE